MSSPRLLRQALPSVPWRGAYSRYRPQETAANEISSANIVVSPPSSPSSEPSMALRPPQSLLYLDSRPSNEGSFQSFPSPAAPSNGLASPLDIPLSLPTYESRPDSSLLLRKSSSLSQEIRPSNEQFSPSSVPSLLAHPSSPRSSPNIRVRHLGEMFHISRSGSLSPAHRHRGRKRLVDLTGRIPKPKYPNTQGAFAFVYKSKLVTSRGTTGVAVKAITYTMADGTEGLLKKNRRLIRELSVWHGLSHPNILPLYGITENFGPLYSMVCPWVASGTLTCYLKSYITMSQRIGLAYDVAAGLRYLHSKEFVHGDISGSNVLILASGEACLSDFGLSRTVTDLFGQSASSSRGYATVRWADPVLCQLEGPHVRPSNSTDIYSLGSITLQVLSAKLPFARYKRDSSVLVPMSKNEKPGRRDDFVHIDHHLWDFMERCWSTTTARPTAQEAEEGLWGQLAADDHRKLPGVRGTEVYLPWIDAIQGAGARL